MRRAEKKDYLLDEAIRLFNRYGYHAMGVDRLMAETGIAKTTLYRHFGSKEGLILAALAKVDEVSRDEMRAFVEKASDDPVKRILAIFDLLAVWFADPEFKGCPFIAAAGEFSAPSDPVFQQARQHKRLTLAYVDELARAARLPEPKRLSQQLTLLLEGAIIYAMIMGPEGVAANAKRAAERLISAAARS